MPPHDELVDVPALLRAIGVPDPDRSRALVDAAELRPPDELQKLRERLFAIHWRLTDWRLRPRSLDFAEFARTAWFGPLDLDDVALSRK